MKQVLKSQLQNKDFPLVLLSAVVITISCSYNSRPRTPKCYSCPSTGAVRQHDPLLYIYTEDRTTKFWVLFLRSKLSKLMETVCVQMLQVSSIKTNFG
jgi:hypothetical protein